jgi:LAS superfamily LD-carboxypeptidase LdcB
MSFCLLILAIMLAESSVSNGTGVPPQKRVSSYPDPSKNPTSSHFAGQTRTHTHQPAAFAGFRQPRWLQSPALRFGFHIDSRIQIYYY